MSEISIWAEHGGLIGLIIFSLFGLVATFIVVLTRKDKSSQQFIKEILANDREERKEDRGEHRDTFNRLSDALNDLTDELRKKDWANTVINALRNEGFFVPENKWRFVLHSTYWLCILVSVERESPQSQPTKQYEKIHRRRSIWIGLDMDA